MMSDKAPSKSYSKMYILVLDNVDLGHAMLAVGHAVAAAMKSFRDTDEMRDWLDNSFRKVVCRVTPEQFDKAKTYGLDYLSMTESALQGADTALVFKPAKDFPPFFKSLSLYR